MDLTLRDLVVKIHSSSINDKVVEDNITLNINGIYTKGRIIVSLKYGDVEMKIKTNFTHEKDRISCPIRVKIIVNNEYKIWSKEILERTQNKLVNISDISFRDIARRYLVNNLSNRLQLSFVDYVNEKYSDLNLTNVIYGTVRLKTSTIMPTPAPLGSYLCVYSIDTIGAAIETCDERLPITEIVITDGNLSFRCPGAVDGERYTINKNDKRVGTFNFDYDSKYKFVDDISVHELSSNLNKYYMCRIKSINSTRYYESTHEAEINFDMEDNDPEIIVNYVFIII
jgi:hypothetical protein